MNRTLDVALVGYGFVGKVFHAPLIAHTPGLRLHTVVSSDAGKVHADHPGVRVLADPEAALTDAGIDLVVIASPNRTHAPLALAALRAGRHVVVDKPFTVDVGEARAVVAAAERAGRMVSVFQNRRWDSDFLTLRRLINDGRLGEVVELHSHFDRFRPQVPDRWRERPEPGAGLWFDLGPHLVDQALQLFGMPEAVQADLARVRAGAQVDDWFHVVLRWPRRRAVLHGSTLVAANGLRLAVHGTRGSYLKHGLDPQEEQLRAGMSPGATRWGEDPAPGELTAFDGDALSTSTVAGVPGDYRNYYAGVRDAIAGGAPAPVTPRQALDTMQVLEAARESAAQGRTVQPGAGISRA